MGDSRGEQQERETAINIKEKGNEGGRFFNTKDVPQTPRVDISILMILNQAGYDISNLKDGDPLDKAAKKILEDKTTSTRTVWRSWPRDPKGQTITPDNTQRGKMTSNGVELWGATIHDFYRVSRHPKLPMISTLTTGSKLAAWMKLNGEEKYAIDEMEWAELEESPKELFPHDLSELIMLRDMRVAYRLEGVSMPSEGARGVKGDNIKEKGKEKGKEKDQDTRKEKDDHSEMEEKTRKANSVPFSPSSYPAPWPLIPFCYATPKLQSHIPLDRLPKKLIVHDPWNLLSANMYEKYANVRYIDWTEKPDVTHEYQLKLSRDAIQRLEAEATELKNKKQESELGGQHTEVHGFLIHPPEDQIGPIEPPIYVIHPPPPPPETIEETHLYISPVHSAGRGNHSIVYRAEWEVPRSLLVPPVLCRACVLEDVEAILKDIDGEDGSRKEARWKEKSATLKRVECVEPPISFAVGQEANFYETRDGETPPRKDVNTDLKKFQVRPGNTHYRTEFEGPVRPIKTRVQWQSPNAHYRTLCPHRPFKYPYPKTTKVTVMAKISLQYDTHLAAEADNYQKFPKHFFEYWNGLNLLPPLHDPTPVGAVVPQFYGHYVHVPKKSMKGKKVSYQMDPGPYRSPILLLEDCGEPVNLRKLNINQKNECASLCYRFHHAGWVHDSIADRNILVQPSPLSPSPLYSLMGIDFPEKEKGPSFRLIDFGRSHIMKDRKEMAGEETHVARLFDHIYV